MPFFVLDDACSSAPAPPQVCARAHSPACEAAPGCGFFSLGKFREGHPAPGRKAARLRRPQSAVTGTPKAPHRSATAAPLRTLTLALLLLLGLGWGEVMGQVIFAPEGLNLPGTWNGNFTNPPTNLAIASSTQVTGGRVILIDTGARRWQTIFSVAASGADFQGGTYDWLFTSGPTDNPFNNTWRRANQAVQLNALQDYFINAGPGDTQITLTNDRWYIMNWRDLGYANTSAIFMEISGEPVQITNVSQSPLAANVAPGHNLTVTVTTNNEPAADEELFIIYTTNNFATRFAVPLNFTGTTGTASIPGQTGGTSVAYYIMSTSAGVNLLTSGQGGVYYDMRSIRIANNGGSNFSYTVNATWVTASGATTWNTPSSWAAGQVPVPNQPVTIAHNIILDTSPSVSGLTINAGQELTFQDGQERALTIATGGTLTNNGTFTANDGRVIFAGAGTVSGNVIFNNVDIAGGVNFGSSGTSTLNGILSINPNGFVQTNPPIYAVGSTLRYNTSGTFTRGSEWPAGTSNAPHHVVVNSDLNMGSHTTPRTLNGDLTLLENRTLTLSTNAAGTINLNGDLIAQTGAEIITGSTDLVLTGAADQNINAPSNFTIPRLRFENPSGNLTSTNAVTLTRLILRSGVFNLADPNLFTITTLDLSGGTLASNGLNANLGTLALSGSTNSLIQLGGSSAHTLTFGDSSTESWSGTSRLTIEGWSGTPGANPSSASDSGRLNFGNNSGLDATRLDRITFAASPQSVAELNTDGELLPGLAAVPTSEGSGESVQSFPTQIILNWNSGDGARRIVVMRAGTEPVSFTPVNGTDYSGNANTNFAIATEVGPAGEGNKIVYEGTGNSVLVSGLAQNTDYHVAIFEYNGQGLITRYLIPALTFPAATAETSFTSRQDGAWNVATTWVDDTIPGASTDVIIGHAVTIPENYTALAASVTITDNGSETPRVTFDDASSVLEISDGGGLISTFVNEPNRFGMAAGSTLRFLGNNTVQGTFEFQNVRIGGAGVNFGVSSSLAGTLEIISGGFVSSNPPEYLDDSTLFVNTGGIYTRGAEWPLPAAGNSPYNVRLASDYAINSRNAAREVRNNLTVEGDGGLRFGTGGASMDAPLTVGGNVLVSGTGIINLQDTNRPLIATGSVSIGEDATITLGAFRDNAGGDLSLGGDFDNQGTFNANNRAIFFEGNNGTQIISTVPGTGFPFWFVRNAVGFGGPTIINSQRIEVDNAGDLQGGANLTVNLEGTRRLVQSGEGSMVINNLNAAGTTRVTGAATVNTYTYTGADLTFIDVDAGGDFSIGTLDTATNIIKQGPGRLSLLQTVANTGETAIDLINIDSGTLRLGPDFEVGLTAITQIGIGSTVSGITDQEAIFETEATSAFASPVTVRTGGDRRIRFSNTGDTAELSGAITLSRLLFVDGSGNGLISGSFSGTHPLVKQGGGTAGLSSAGFPGGLFVDEGVLRLEGGFTFSNPAQGFVLGAESAPLNESDATLEIAGIALTIRNNLTVRTGDGTRNLRFVLPQESSNESTFSIPIVLNKGLSIFTAQNYLATLTGAISGSGSVTKEGAGDLQLTNNIGQQNTFSGGVRLEAGGIRIGTGAVLAGTHSPLGTGTLTIALNDVTMSSSSGTARTIPVPVSVQGNFQIGRSGGTGTLTFTGDFNFTNAPRTVTVFDDITGVIEGDISNGDLIKAGAGTLTLRGINTYGSTTINAGTLQLGRTAESGFVIPGAVTINTGAILNYGSTQNNQINNSSHVTINGGTFSLGTRVETIGSLTMNGGTLNRGGVTAGLTINGVSALNNNSFVNFTAGDSRITFKGDITTNDAVYFNYDSSATGDNIILLEPEESATANITVNSGSLNFNISNTGVPGLNLRDGNRAFNVAEGASVNLGWVVRSSNATSGSITKSGPGTLTLSGANTYAGGTIINGGEVIINNSAGLGGTANQNSLALNNATLTINENVTLGNNRPVTISGTPTIQVAENRTFTIEGTLGESGVTPLTKTGPGTLTLDGNASFTGATAVQAGVLNVNADFVSTDLSIEDGSELNFGGSGDPRVLTLSGLSIGSDATLTLGGDNDVFTIPDTFPVTIPATATVNTSGDGARLTLQSGARYVNLSSSIPTLRVERAFAGDNTNSDRQGWRMLASPVETSYQDMFETDANPSTFVTQGFTGSTYSNRQFNLLWWDETDSTGTTLQRWRIPEGASETIPAGRGHFFYIFDGAPLLNPGSGEPTNYTDNLPLTMSATGVEPNLTDNNLPFISGSRFQLPVTFTAVSDSVVVDDTFIGALVQDQGWNLVGNPTASWLDWNAADSGTPAPWTKTNMSNVIYVWDPSANGGNGDYLVTNGDAGNHDGYIAPFQAFWVQAVAQDPVLSFGNDAKTVAPNTNSGFVGRPVMSAAGPGASDFHGVSPNNTETSDGPDAGGGATVLPLRLRVAEGGAARTAEKFVMLSERGQFGADRWDAYRLQPMSDSWLTLASAMAPGSAPLVINSLPAAQAIGGPLNLPLYVGGATAGQPLAGQFTLEWELPADWDPDLSLVLMDHELQRAIPMRGTQRSYSFSHATDPGMIGLMVSPAPGDGSGFGGPAQIGTPSPAPARGAATGRTAQASVASSGTAATSASTSASTSTSASASASVPLLPATLLGGTHLPADWSPDFTATAALLPEGLATAPARPDDAHIPYIPLAVAAEDSGSGSGTGTALGRSLPAGSGGAVPEARFSIFMQPLSGGPGADETIPYTPIGISLAQNYPNPFNPATTVRFSLPEEAEIRLEVFDLLGRRIALLAADRFPAGTHTLRWDATGQATGLYLLRLSAPETGTVQTRKMMLVR